MNLIRTIYHYIRQNERVSAALILAGCVFIFISPGIFTKGYYSPADIILRMDLFANGNDAHNYLLSDVLLQSHPWQKLSREIVRSGSFPLWNIYSGGGLPLFANMQSAVLYPLTFFFYILDFKYALLASSFIKLFMIGFFAYLYFKEIKISHCIAIAGAIGFMFAGYNFEWLMWPHTNIVFLLPCGLFLIERYFKTSRNIYILWFSIALATGLFGGHPETFFHIVFILILYVIYRLWIVRSSRQPIFRHMVKLLTGGVIGAGLAAILLIPFYEYLKLSDVWVTRGLQANEFYLNWKFFVLNFIPDFFGNQAFIGKHFIPDTNYNESTPGYVGITLLLFALYAIMTRFKDSLIKFYFFISLLCIAIIYKTPIIYDLIIQLPGFHLSANNRLLMIYGFAVAALGTFGLQKLHDTKWLRSGLISTIIIFFGLALILVIPGFLYTKLSVAAKDWTFDSRWQITWLIIFIFNFAVLLLVLFKLPEKFKIGSIIILILLETGIHGMFYNSVTENKDFYPESSIVNYLQKQFPDGYYRTFSNQLIIPNLGTWYGFNQINEYDAIGLKSYQALKERIGPFSPDWEIFYNKISFKMLMFLGTKYAVFPLKYHESVLKGRSDSLKLVLENDKAIIVELPAFPRAYILNVQDHNQLESYLSRLMQNPNKNELIPVTSYHLDISGAEQVKYNISEPGYLVLNENYFPGMKAYLDGKQIAIEECLGLRTISLPAGKHEIIFSYITQSFIRGLTISLISFSVWMVLMILSWKQPAVVVPIKKEITKKKTSRKKR